MLVDGNVYRIEYRDRERDSYRLLPFGNHVPPGGGGEKLLTFAKTIGIENLFPPRKGMRANVIRLSSAVSLVKDKIEEHSRTVT